MRTYGCIMMNGNISKMSTGVTPLSVDTDSDVTTAISTLHYAPNSSVFNVVQGVLYGSILLLGLIFNLCVILVIRRHRSLHKVTNMWVTSLCTGQLFLCILSLPFIVTSVFADRWLFGFHFCRIFGFYTSVFRTTSMLSVAGIALARHHIMTRPFNARIHKTSVRFHIAVTWWCAIVAAVPPLFGIGLYRYSSSSHACGLSVALGGSSLAYIVLYFIVVYVSPLLVTSVAYRRIYKVTKAQASKRRRPSVAGGLASGFEMSRAAVGLRGNVSDLNAVRTKQTMAPAKRRLTAVINGKVSQVQGSLRHRFSISSANSTIDHRAGNTIVLVLMLFVCTWIPYYAFAIYAASTLPDTKLSDALSWIEFLTFWLSLTNVVWDPILYGLLNQNFKARLKESMSSSRLGNLFEKKTQQNSRCYGGQMTDNNITVMEIPTTNVDGIDGVEGSRFEGIAMTDETYKDYEIARESCNTAAESFEGFYVGDAPVLQSNAGVSSIAKRRHRKSSSRDPPVVGNSRLFFIPPNATSSQKGHRSDTMTSTSTTDRPWTKSQDFLTRYGATKSELYPRSSNKHARSKSVQCSKTYDNINYDGFHQTLRSSKSNMPASQQPGAVASDGSGNTAYTRKISTKRRRRFTADHSYLKDQSLSLNTDSPASKFHPSISVHAKSNTRLRRDIAQTLRQESELGGFDSGMACQSLDRGRGRTRADTSCTKRKDDTTKRTFAIDV